LHFRLPQLETLVPVDDEQVFFIGHRFIWVVCLKYQNVEKVDIGRLVTDDALLVVILLIVKELDVCIFKVKFIPLSN